MFMWYVMSVHRGVYKCAIFNTYSIGGISSIQQIETFSFRISIAAPRKLRLAKHVLMHIRLCVCACVYSLICNISMCELYNRQLWETTAVRVLTIHLPLAWVPADCLSVCLSVRQSVHLLKSTIIAWEFINKSHTLTLRNICINICMYLLLFIRLTNKIVILKIKQNHWLVLPGPVTNPPPNHRLYFVYGNVVCVCVCVERLYLLWDGMDAIFARLERNNGWTFAMKMK